jgi:DnaJ-class molecular chaperone
VAERVKEVCETCDGAGRVVDERQAGEPVSTCMTCKGNGWVYTDKKPLKPHAGWLKSPKSTVD